MSLVDLVLIFFVDEDSFGVVVYFIDIREVLWEGKLTFHFLFLPSRDRVFCESLELFFLNSLLLGGESIVWFRWLLLMEF